MKHDWEPISSPNKYGDWSNFGRRRCKNCELEQTKQAQYFRMRVTGYRWLPLVGRCNGRDGSQR